MEITKKYLTTEEAAAYLCCSKSFLNKERVDGVLGIPYTKLGRKVLYAIKDLDAYMEDGVRKSTSQDDDILGD